MRLCFLQLCFCDTCIYLFLHEQEQMFNTKINKPKSRNSNEQEISVFFLQGSKTEFTVTIDVGKDQINTLESVYKDMLSFGAMLFSPLSSCCNCCKMCKEYRREITVRDLLLQCLIFDSF